MTHVLRDVRRTFRHTLSSLVLGTLVTATSFSAQADTLRMGMVTPPSHIWNKVSERFNNTLQEATGGKTKIKVYPLSKLGGEQQMIDLLQSGGMQQKCIAVEYPVEGAAIKEVVVGFTHHIQPHGGTALPGLENMAVEGVVGDGSAFLKVSAQVDKVTHFC